MHCTLRPCPYLHPYLGRLHCSHFATRVMPSSNASCTTPICTRLTAHACHTCFKFVKESVYAPFKVWPQACRAAERVRHGMMMAVGVLHVRGRLMRGRSMNIHDAAAPVDRRVKTACLLKVSNGQSNATCRFTLRLRMYCTSPLRTPAGRWVGQPQLTHGMRHIHFYAYVSTTPG